MHLCEWTRYTVVDICVCMCMCVCMCVCVCGGGGVLNQPHQVLIFKFNLIAVKTVL